MSLEPLQLVREAIRQSKKLEPYNEELVKNIMSDITTLYSEALIWSEAMEHSPTASIFDNQSQARLVAIKSVIERNKRILLAYQAARLDCISRAALSIANLPEKFLGSMTQSEQIFLTDYSDNLRAYMSTFGGLLDICANQAPPRDLYIQVRVNRDCGVIQTEWGQLHLSPNSAHFVRRADVQSLIDQGLVSHIR